MKKSIETKKKFNYVFLFCAGSFAVNLYVAQMSPLAIQIMGKFGISDGQYTSLYMSNLLPSLFLGIPSAWLVRRFGLKMCQCVGILIGLAGLILRLSDVYWIFYIGTLIIGAANVVVSTMAAATSPGLFKKENVGIAVGCLIAAGAAGKALAESTTSLFPSFEVMSAVDIILQIIVLLAWLTMMDGFEYSDTEAAFSKTFVTVLRNKYIWIGALALMLVFGLYTGISAHLPTILQEKGYYLVSAGFIASFISIGYFAGAVFLPKLATKIWRKKLFMVALALISSLFTAFAYWVQQEALLTVSIFVIGACVGGLLPLSIAIPASVLNFGVQESQAAGPVLTAFQLAGAVLIPTYIIVPLAGGNILGFLGYAAIFMIVEAMLFTLLPKNRKHFSDKNQ